MDLTCASCKKQLWHQTADGPKNDGYYLYDDKAYCADCWMIEKHRENVSGANPEPELAV